MSERQAMLRAELDGEETTLRVSDAGEVTFANDDAPRVNVRRAPSPGLREGRGEGWPADQGSSPRTVDVSDDSHHHRARVALAGNTAWVFVDGDVFAIELEDAQHERARRRDRSSEGALAAPMPATVSKLLVAIGQEVAAGDTLLLLEAMKMEMPIKAPHAGRVSAIRCQVGELVQPGVSLIEIDAAP